MDGRAATKEMAESNVTYKREEVMETYDHLHPKEIWHIKEDKTIRGRCVCVF